MNLIDYMDDVLDVHKEEHESKGPGTNFQAASATLDASIKVCTVLYYSREMSYGLADLFLQG